MLSKEEKKKLIKKHSEGSPVLKNSLKAFFFGGLICVFSELLLSLFINLGADEKNALTFVSISVIFLSSLLTALGFFDKIARTTGAGTLVPVSGFSVSVMGSVNFPSVLSGFSVQATQRSMAAIRARASKMRKVYLFIKRSSNIL